MWLYRKYLKPGYYKDWYTRNWRFETTYPTHKSDSTQIQHITALSMLMKTSTHLRHRWPCSPSQTQSRGAPPSGTLWATGSVRPLRSPPLGGRAWSTWCQSPESGSHNCMQRRMKIVSLHGTNEPDKKETMKWDFFQFVLTSGARWCFRSSWAALCPQTLARYVPPAWSAWHRGWERRWNVTKRNSLFCCHRRCHSSPAPRRHGTMLPPLKRTHLYQQCATDSTHCLLTSTPPQKW